MTVERGREVAPDPDDETGRPRGERPETFVGLISQAVSGWPTTLRVAALLALLIVALWLLPVDLTLGPLQITRH